MTAVEIRSILPPFTFISAVFCDPVTIEFQVFCYDSLKLDVQRRPAAYRVATGLRSVKPRRQVESVAAD
jgi:hypothetical protein